MKNKLFYGILAIIVSISGGCVARQPAIPPATSSKSNFNLFFKYGVGAKNVLNTFEGTYTKDMVMDSSITIKLSLSNEELDRIYKKMVEIDFFNYPDNFSVSVPSGERMGIRTPYSMYYFKVKYNSKIKKLLWDDSIVNKDEKVYRLKELIKLITDIIESKEEYKKLPPARGGYL